MRCLILPVCILGVGVPATSLPGAFDWPAPACKLKVEAYQEYMESVQLPRIRLEGCLVIEADPPRRFYEDPDLPGDCSQQFYFSFEPEIKLQMRIYPDKGRTAFGAPQWNTLLQSVVREDEEITVNMRTLFEDKGTGPPILGYVSLKAEVVVTEVVDGTEITTVHQHYLVPAEEEGLVLLVSLVAPEPFISTVYPLFDRFVRGMYQP